MRSNIRLGNELHAQADENGHIHADKADEIKCAPAKIIPPLIIKSHLPRGTKTPSVDTQDIGLPSEAFRLEMKL
jgi:hypothetical protein